MADVPYPKNQIFKKNWDSNECKVCPTELDDGRKSYCSKKCRRIRNLVMRMHYWDMIREKVLERDNYECQHCGKDLQEKFSELLENGDVSEGEGPSQALQHFHVKHIVDPEDGGSKYSEANMVTLCSSCSSSNIDMESLGPMDSIPLKEYIRSNKEFTSLRSSDFGDGNDTLRCPNCNKNHSFKTVFRYGKKCECGYNLEIRAVAYEENTEDPEEVAA